MIVTKDRILAHTDDPRTITILEYAYDREKAPTECAYCPFAEWLNDGHMPHKLCTCGLFTTEETYARQIELATTTRVPPIIGMVRNRQPICTDMMGMVRELLADNLQKKQMMGGPVNLMAEVIRANQMAGMDMAGIDMAKYGVKAEKIEKPPDPSVDPTWFTKQAKDRVWDNPRWVDIAKAYLDLEKASDANTMILAIDRLNQLQHNSFHLLIDLQSGRMLEGRSEGDTYSKHDSARLNVQKILDICAKKESVYTFIDKLSPDIANLLREYRATKRAIKQ